MLSRLCAALGALILIACTGEAPGSARNETPASTPGTVVAAAGPALWAVKDADTTIYLFGTIHMLPEGTDWMRPAIAKAFDASDTLVLEVLGTNDAKATTPVILKMGYTPGLPPLAERVPAGERDELAAAITHAGVPVAALDAMETWLATMSLSTARIQKLGYGIEGGVEYQLSTRAAAQRKRIEGLETMAEQLGFFDTLPEAEQRTLLVNSLDDIDDIDAVIKNAVNSWVVGDIDAVADLLEDDTRDSPGLAKRLLTDRNLSWANWIEKRLESTPGTVFVAVGSGHLAGKDSVQSMLEAKGLKVERLN
ncbi:TraB/GumN family protein [Sphingosinicella sp.]|uniref:TraB/GumN family protein n=1 Tax=Sphingosinicella sp. TaxID=1917971 RepID=UPI0017C292DD|nr:TraB/GumN family protein [Sphingosinicella sp.]MBA4757903.1 TraB/GumN family protein [Sphingosinicella sp.]